MSDYLQFETNLEAGIVTTLLGAGIKAEVSRDLSQLGASNVQVSLQYMGAREDSRKLHKNYQEYDLHQAQIEILVVTYRDNFGDHHRLLGQVRSLMLNHKQPFGKDWYHVYDIKPLNTNQLNDEETNTDQTTLAYEISFQLNFANLE